MEGESRENKKLNKIFEILDISEKELWEKLDKEIFEDDILKKLCQEYDFTSFLYFDTEDLERKLSLNASLRQQINLKKIKEVKYLESLEFSLKEKKAKLYDYYKTNDPRKLSKTEIENYYLFLDDDLNKLNKLIRIQKIIVDYFSIVLESFQSQQWNIKNRIELIKNGY